MATAFFTARHQTAGTAGAGRRKRLWHGIVALALTLPNTAQPCALQVLLHLPLEHLLQMEISPRRVSARGCRAASACPPLVEGARRAA